MMGVCMDQVKVCVQSSSMQKFVDIKWVVGMIGNVGIIVF